MTIINKRMGYAATAITVLVTMYMLQRFNFSAIIFGQIVTGNTEFIVNRIIRFMVNDLAVILLIYAIFKDKDLMKIAFMIQIIELIFILPIYFYIKLSFEGPSEISSPLLSFVHRIVVNPIIMLLLIPAFWFQRKSAT